MTAPLTIVELSALHPWATSVTRGARTSRLNLLSAIASVGVIEAMLAPSRQPRSEDGPRRGLIITPYRPQAELLGAMLRARNLNEDVTAGTIHAFQGSEASIVVLDLTVAEPHYRAAIFSEEFDEAHRRMLNVAVTRARRRLVVVADGPFVREHASGGTATRNLMRLLIGARELAATAVIDHEGPDRLLNAVTAADRDAVWFVDDAERDPALAAAVAAAARRGLNVCVVTQAGRERRIGLRDVELTRLDNAGATIIVKRPLRESLVLVDGHFAAVRPHALDGWSVWDDASVAAHVGRAQEAPLLLRLASNEHHGSCPQCGKIIELREGDHARSRIYALCAQCRRPVDLDRRRKTRAPAGQPAKHNQRPPEPIEPPTRSRPASVPLPLTARPGELLNAKHRARASRRPKRQNQSAARKAWYRA